MRKHHKPWDEAQAARREEKRARINPKRADRLKHEPNDEGGYDLRGDDEPTLKK